MMNCADKFLKHSERVGARFAEQNAGAQPSTLRKQSFGLIAKRCRRGYECRVSTKVGCGRTHLLYRPSPLIYFPHPSPRCHGR